MEEEIDIFLPFLWIAKHPPQGDWEYQEIQFNSARCLGKCTKYETLNFSLTWDVAVAMCPQARIIGHVAMVSDPQETIPEEFREYLDLMSKVATDALPEHKSYDCQIELRKGEVAPWGPIYPLSEVELKTLRKWLKEMLKSGKIHRSMLPAGSPILFVPKPNRRCLRLCADYRALNRITISNRYPLPLMQEVQDRVQGAQFFTKMDLRNGFNLIWVREGDK